MTATKFRNYTRMQSVVKSLGSLSADGCLEPKTLADLELGATVIAGMVLQVKMLLIDDVFVP